MAKRFELKQIKLKSACKAHTVIIFNPRFLCSMFGGKRDIYLEASEPRGRSLQVEKKSEGRSFSSSPLLSFYSEFGCIHTQPDTVSSSCS